MYDGMRVNNMEGAGSTTGFVVSPNTLEEWTVETGGVSAESDASGVVVNFIPKEGGNNWSGNLRVIDNLEVEPSDFSPYCVTAPSDPRLPGGGGYQVCALYDVSPAKFGLARNLVTRASNYGDWKITNDNVFNDSSVMASNNTYGSQWLRPISDAYTGGAILAGRLFQFGARMRF